MLVRKTNKGRFTIALSFELRDQTFRALIAYLEDESVRVRQVKLTHEDGVMRHLYYTTLNEFLKARDFCLVSPEEIKWTISRTHAIALMWLLRHYDDNMSMLQLKSELHKMLQP